MLKLINNLLDKKTEEKFSLTEIPTESSLFMSDICNFKCKGCRRSVLEMPDSKMLDVSTVKATVEKYPSIKSYCIAGQGEPTLNKNFSEIIDYLRLKKKITFIVTNGSNIEPFLQLKHKPNCISISLYGYDRDSYVSYCGMDVFDRVISNYKQLRKKFKNVGFSFILNKSNYTSLEKVAELCDEIKPAFLNLVNYLAYDVSNAEERDKIIKITDLEIIEYIENVCVKRKYIKDKPFYLNPENKEFCCNSYFQMLSLDGEGNIGACRSHNVPDESFGNIFNENDPFNSSKMTEIRRAISEGVFPEEACQCCFRRQLK